MEPPRRVRLYQVFLSHHVCFPFLLAGGKRVPAGKETRDTAKRQPLTPPPYLLASPIRPRWSCPTCSSTRLTCKPVGSGRPRAGLLRQTACSSPLGCSSRGAAATRSYRWPSTAAATRSPPSTSTGRSSPSTWSTTATPCSSEAALPASPSPSPPPSRTNSLWRSRMGSSRRSTPPSGRRWGSRRLGTPSRRRSTRRRAPSSAATAGRPTRSPATRRRLYCSPARPTSSLCGRAARCAAWARWRRARLRARRRRSPS